MCIIHRMSCNCCYSASNTLRLQLRHFILEKQRVKGKNVEQSPQVEKAAKLDTGSRRSSRHRKVRGEKEIEVSSTQKTTGSEN